MICKTRRFACVPTAASTAFNAARSTRRVRCIVVLVLGILIVPRVQAEPLDPEVSRLLERTVEQAENFRKQLQTVEYEAKMRVREWDGRGRLRGTAKAHAVVRPGTAQPLTFITREVQGKVRLPAGNKEPETKEKDVTLQEFAREHRIAERFEFDAGGWEQIAGQRARRISFKPKPDQPEKTTADRFLDTITGSAWVSDEAKLVKFELRLMRPFQLFWIFAVLQDLTVQYELITPGQILGQARVKVLFFLKTPVYSIRQQHDVDLNNFRPRSRVLL